MNIIAYFVCTIYYCFVSASCEFMLVQLGILLGDQPIDINMKVVYVVPFIPRVRFT